MGVPATSDAQPRLLDHGYLRAGVGLRWALAVFSIVRATLFYPEPYADPERVVFLWAHTKEDAAAKGSFSPPDMLDIREQSRTIAGVAAVNSFAASIVGTDGEPEQIQLGVTTGNFFHVLGVDARARQHVFAGWFTRRLGPLLLGLSSTDATAYSLSVGITLITSLIACSIPALRAARIPLRDVLSGG